MDPANPLNKKLPAVVGVAAAGVALYWTFTYTGPFRYLAELQLKWFHSYSPKLTALVIILGLVGIAGLIKLVLRGAERPIPGVASPAPVSLPSHPAASVVARPLTHYIRFAAPLILFGIGVWAYGNGVQAGSLQELSADDFQNGNLHARIMYAEVKGRLSEMYISKNHYLYIPMSAKSGAPVQLLVGVGEYQTEKYLHPEADGSFTVQGVADKGLEGDVKYAFEKNGIAVADPVWVVHTGREPSGDKKFGAIMMVVGIVFGVLLYGWDSYRQRKNAAARPLKASA
ncbi:MAG TPA: hypothetical protein VMH48_02395 [Methylomirabilota bacterium]|nr:hypothetical protein [Methylomirabilota bacterium]